MRSESDRSLLNLVVLHKNDFDKNIEINKIINGKLDSNFGTKI